MKRLLFALSILAVVIAACGSSERPTSEAWAPRWEVALAAIPPLDELGDQAAEEVCETSLAAVRSQAEELLPSPTSEIDEYVDAWVALAEATFFECPPDQKEINSFDAAYSELARIEDSVESALEDV